MKIYFDDIIFDLQKAGGISKVWAKLCENFKTKDLINLQSDISCNNVFYPKNLKKIEKDINIKLSIRRYLPILKIINCDIFHSSYYRIPLFINKNAKQVVTVHDFMYEFFDSGLKKHIHIWQKTKAMKYADSIICVSEHTKNDLLKLYPQFKNKNIYVVYNGVDEEFTLIENKKDFIKINDKDFENKKYFLYVGNRMGCKNFKFIIELMQKSIYLNKNNLNIVCVGGGKFTEEELALFNKFNYENKVHHVSNIDNYELNSLYNHALALLFPSSYEGFGIPALEAQKAGCPVIYAKTSSLPEVMAYDELSYTLDSIEEIEEKFSLLENADLINVLIDKGLTHANKLSWEYCASETLKVYERTLGLNNE